MSLKLKIGICCGVVAIGALLFFLVLRPNKTSDEKKSQERSNSGTATQEGTGKVSITKRAKGSVAGTIRDQDGKALAEAKVCAYASSEELAAEDLHNLNCVQSGLNGAYQFPSLLPATYSLGASKPSYLPALHTFEDEEKEEKNSFKLAAKEARTAIDIQLEKGGVEVKGIVRDIGGGTVAGAWVSVSEGYQFGFGFFGGQQDASAVTTSADDGTFSVWVPKGNIHTTAQVSGYANSSKSSMAPGQFIEIILTPESVLAGQVVESTSGKPVPNAVVSAGSGGWSGQGSTARTDSEGYFRITRLSPGRYKPSAETEGGYGVAAQSVLLGLGQTQEGILVKLHPAYVVTGQVVIEGEDKPCTKKANVSLEDSAGQNSDWAGYDDELGMIRFKALLPATYNVKVRCSGYVSEEEYADIEIVDADHRDLVWKVKTGLSLRGRVVSSEGVAVPDVRISARSKGGDPRAQSTRGNSTSEEDGSFEIEGLLSGTYSLSARSDEYTSPDNPQEVELSSSSNEEIEMVISKGATLIGLVVDEEGKAIKGASISARSMVRGWRSSGNATALDDGTFEITALKPGSYRLTASMGRWGGETLRGIGKGDDDVQGKVVAVSLDKKQEVTLVVQSQNGSISGIVVDEQGKPVSDAFVDSERQSDSAGAVKGRARRTVRWGQWDSQPVLTDMEGRFTLDSLADGTYTVFAHRKGGGEAFAEDVAIGDEATLTIRTTGSLKGRVSIEGGTFPVQFTISVADKETGFSRSETYYRTEGSWSLSDIPKSSLDIQVTATEGTANLKAVALGEGEDKGGINLSLEARSTVTGQLVSLETEEPVSGMHISISPASGGRFSFSRGDKERITDEEGRFVVEDAPAGRVQVMAFPKDWMSSEYGWMRSIANVKAGEKSDVGILKIARRRLEQTERAGDLGFTLHERDPKIEPEDSVTKVALIRPTGPALKSGLKAGDIISAVDGHNIRGANSYLYSSLAQVKEGTTITLSIVDGDDVTITAGPAL